MKRILRFISQMLQEQENEKVVEYLNEMDIMDVIPTGKKLFTDNIVLNYILNRANEKCMENGIDFSCIVNGVIGGISDLDIHILMENLIDNALDAIAKSSTKSLYIVISSNEGCIRIEIDNSVSGNVLLKNPDFENTTKNDKLRHGYGMKNIRDIIERYHGNIEYIYIEPDSVRCKIVLIKNKM